ncbi:MAG: PilZ domain-containing protein [Planctomycetota bacterium]
MTLAFPHPANQDDFDEGLPGGEFDTARLWVSDQQWMTILERVERGSDGEETENAIPDYAGGASDASGNREYARHAINFRCMIRLAPPDKPDADHGTYVVHSRNISTGGLGFVHDQELHTGTRCTVALQPMRGKGMIVPARVAWCRSIRRELEGITTYDIGVQFDRPIDISPFVPAA